MVAKERQRGLYLGQARLDDATHDRLEVAGSLQKDNEVEEVG